MWLNFRDSNVSDSYRRCYYLHGKRETFNDNRSPSPSLVIQRLYPRTSTPKTIFERLGKEDKRVDTNGSIIAVRNRHVQYSKGQSLRRTISQLSLASLHRREAYDRRIACWNCKKVGHHRRFCRAPRKIFCSYCQTEDIRTHECRCRERVPGDIEKFRVLMHEPLEALRIVQIGTGYGLRIDVKILQRNLSQSWTPELQLF